ncbi:MAG: helix-turn-helix domain-containing protein [Solirubrobacteraceae bacterium]
MLILSPEERAQAWYDAVSAETEQREYKRHMLATAAFQMVGSELSLYSDDYAVAFKDTFDLLELSGLIGRDELREAFEEIDEDVGIARAFAAALGRQLRATAAIERLDASVRGRAAALAELWREAAAEDVTGRVEDDGEVYVTVAEVAAAYDVTPQAVYKWIHRGVIDAHARPGGSYRIPISALTRDERFDVGRARRLQETLSRTHEAEGSVSTEEMLEQMRSRRRSSP